MSESPGFKTKKDPSHNESRHASGEAVVISSTRRYAFLALAHGDIIKARVGSQLEDVTIGDHIRWENDGSSWTVVEISPRRNQLTRTFGKATKSLAANVDLVMIFTAPGALYNPSFIDRVLAVTAAQGIESALIVNKSDLDEAGAQEIVSIYRELTRTLIVSVKTGDNLDEFEALLKSAKYQIVAFTGVSGVGKSSALTKLVPDLDLKVQEVSQKTGQGRQTTSQGYGFEYKRQGSNPALLVDLPGIQKFGVTHLDRPQVLKSFNDFVPHALHCEYDNCTHIAEQTCGVKDAVAAGEIAQTRYLSYTEMLKELELAREY